MIGTSLGEWLVIRLIIVLFRFQPLLFASAIASVWALRGNATWDLTAIKVLCGLLAAEAVFYLTIWLPYTRGLDKPAVHPPAPAPAQRRELFTRCLDTAPSPEAYLRGWFLGAELSDIRRDNLREFLCWAFFDKALDCDSEADAEISTGLDAFVTQLEARLNHEFEPGRGSATSLRVTLDAFHTTYRSLTWYLIVALIDQLTYILMRWHGFEYFASPSTVWRVFPPRPLHALGHKTSPTPALSYWYRPHQPTAGEEGVPLVFFHGIGLGLWIYVRFFADLLRAMKARSGTNQGIIAVEMLPVSFHMSHAMPDRAEWLNEMVKVVDAHGWSEFAVASHSYGSVPTSHLLHAAETRDRVKAVILIDPVTVMLHLPSVAYNFTRRAPVDANEWQLWYFAGTDPGVAHCLARHFFWRENIVWREELQRVSSRHRSSKHRARAAVCLSGRDLIVDTDSVVQYLTEDGTGLSSGKASGSIEVVIFPKLDHAQVFDSPQDLARVVEIACSYCASSSSSK